MQDGRVVYVPRFGGGGEHTIDVLYSRDGAETALARFSAAALPATTEPTWEPGDGALPAAALGEPLDLAFASAYGDLFTVTSGALPDGLELSTAGALTGTPAAAGRAAFTVRAARPGAGHAYKAFTMVVAEEPRWSTAAELPPATEGGPPYSTPLLAAGGEPTYAVVDGSPPAGLAVSPAGALRGTASAAGTAVFTVRAASADAPGEVFSDRRFSLTVTPPPPAWITAARLAPVAQGAVWETALRASGDGTTYELAADAPPHGVKLSSDGALTGTPSEPGEARFTVRASGAGGSMDRRFFVTVAQRPVWSTEPALAAAAEGAPWATRPPLAASGAGTTYALIAGALPRGLALAPDGTLSGAPLGLGDYAFRVRAASAEAPAAVFADRHFTLTVAHAPAWGTGAALAPAARGEPWETRLVASGAGTTFALVSGAPPADVELAGDGLISGTPGALGAAAFTVRAKSAGAPDAVYADRRFEVTVAHRPAWETAAALEPVPAGQPWSRQLAADGAGTTYALLQATPPGAALAGDGALSVPATGPGEASFTVRARSAAAPEAVFSDRRFTVTVAHLPAWQTGSAMPPIPEAKEYTQALAASGDGTAFELIAGALPPGLSLSGGGVLSGAPRATGDAAFTVRAASARAPDAVHADREFTLRVAHLPAWRTGPALAPVSDAAPWALRLDASGAGTTYAVVSGSLPSGTRIAADGALSGTPDALGVSAFTVRASSAGAPAALHSDRQFSVTAVHLPAWSTGGELRPAARGEPDLPPLRADGDGTTYALVGGAPPRGVRLAAGGALIGAPADLGHFAFTVRAESARAPAAVFAERRFALTVAHRPAWATGGQLQPVARGEPDLPALRADGDGTTYALVAGALPSGVALSAAGELSGTPDKIGDAAFTVRAASALAPAVVHADREFAITVAERPAWSTAAVLPVAARGAPLYARLAASGAGTTYSVVSGRVPAGTRLAPDGTLSGTPAELGTAKFTVRAESAGAPASVHAERRFTMEVTPMWETGWTASSARGGAPLAVRHAGDVANGVAYSTALQASPVRTYGVAPGPSPLEGAAASFTFASSAGSRFAVEVHAVTRFAGVGYLDYTGPGPHYVVWYLQRAASDDLPAASTWHLSREAALQQMSVLHDGMPVTIRAAVLNQSSALSAMSWSLDSPTGKGYDGSRARHFFRCNVTPSAALPEGRYFFEDSSR